MVNGNAKWDGSAMRKGLKSYCLILAIVLVIATGILVGVSKLSIYITDCANKKYMPLYLEGEKGYSSPWYTNGLHIVDEGFIDELSDIKANKNNVISIGSSMSRISFRDEEAKLPDSYRYEFLVCGNGCHRSDRIFVNILENENLLNKENIIKYEISFSTFRQTDMTIAESSIEKWGAYKVNEDLSVAANSTLKLPIYELNKLLLKIQNVGELYLTENNFCNNYFNYDAVAKSCYMDEDMCKSVEKDICRIAQESNCVVEISPFPNGLAVTDYGKELQNYIDNELIPTLNDKGIPYFDYRNDYQDNEFADGVHLSYNASVEYTNRLNEDLAKIIEEIN